MGVFYTPSSKIRLFAKECAQGLFNIVVNGISLSGTNQRWLDVNYVVTEMGKVCFGLRKGCFECFLSFSFVVCVPCGVRMGGMRAQ